MATIDGEKKELRNGLYSVTRRNADGTTMVALYNSRKDVQFNVVHEFRGPSPDMTPLGTTQRNGDKFATVVYPLETREVCCGRWQAMKQSFSFGAPDQEWQERQQHTINAAIDQEISAVKAALRSQRSPDGKYTAEYIMDVCMGSGVRFVDLTFPPKGPALSREWEGAAPAFAFQRPQSFVGCEGLTPELFVGSIEPNDIDQGQLGNCYFLSAIACLSEFEPMVRRCFLSYDMMLGACQVLLCKSGWWQTVTVDDALPTRNGKPVYAKNRSEPNELWVSLLEKAYAKIHGSYKAIKAGDAGHALADMVAGPTVRMKEHEAWTDKAAFFTFLRNCDDDDHLMTLGTPGTDLSAAARAGDTTQPSATAAETAAKYRQVGLVSGHCYSLIRVKEYNGLRLCMLRNPWGDGVEWNGKWSDSDPGWTPPMKAALGFEGGDDGTFWMEWADVVKWFDSGNVCYSLPSWPTVRVAGNWDRGVPDVILEVTVGHGASVELWAGAHQKDSRGLPTGDPDRSYHGVMIAVQQRPASGAGSATVAVSHGGRFLPARETFAHCTLRPAPDRPYYVVCQAFHDTPKSFVASLFLSQADNVSVRFLGYEQGKAQKCVPPARFSPGNCPTRVAADYQLSSPHLQAQQRRFVQLQGDCVDFAHRPAAAGSPPPRKVAAPQPKPKAPAAAPPGSTLVVRMKAVSGHALAVCDIGGKSDPYLTLSFTKGTGEPFPNSPEVATKYIKKTLDPVWDETVELELPMNNPSVLKVLGVDVHCWDKDLFGKDDMGRAIVPLADFEINAAPKRMELRLQGKDAKGHVVVELGVVAK